MKTFLSRLVFFSRYSSSMPITGDKKLGGERAPSESNKLDNFISGSQVSILTLIFLLNPTIYFPLIGTFLLKNLRLMPEQVAIMAKKSPSSSRPLVLLCQYPELSLATGELTSKRCHVIS